MNHFSDSISVLLFPSSLQTLQTDFTVKNNLSSKSAYMANTNVEWDGITSQAPRPTDDDGIYHSSNISSESSESISESDSLLGKDNKQAGSYGATEIRGEEPEVVAESDGTTEVQKTPKAIAAMIGVLLVGEEIHPIFVYMIY